MSRAGEVVQAMDRTLRKIEAAYEKKHGEPPPGAQRSSGNEAVDCETPAHALMRKEAAMGITEPQTLPLFAGMNGSHKTPFEELDEFADSVAFEGEEALRMLLEAHFWLLDFLFAEGPHPGRVMRRLYAWVKKFRPSAIWDAGYRHLGELLGESHGTMEWRIGALIDGYAASKGIKGVKMPWQRGADVSATLSAAQRGNTNRLGGKKRRLPKKEKQTQ